MEGFSFLDELISKSLLVRADEPIDPRRRQSVFFTDVYDFQEDRLFSPLGVELELTLKCNRNCLYCAYQSSPFISTSDDLPRSIYQDLFRQFADAGVCYIRFTGGDPLTRSDCLDILKDASRYHFGLAIASDLTSFKEQTAEQLGHLSGVTALQTTLDGPTPEIADRLRGHGNFRRVTRGLDLLEKYKIPTVVGTILTKHNVASIYDTAKFLSRWKVSWCVSPLYAAGRGGTCSNLIPDDDDLSSACEQFARAVDEGLVTAADPSWETISSSRTPEARARLWDGQPWLVRSPDRVLRVDPRGRCYTSIHLKEALKDDVYVGSVCQDEIITLWNTAPLLNELRSASQRNSYFGSVFDVRSIRR